MFNFSYGIWHDFGGVGEAIDRYGSENRYKQGFQLTSKAERADLFSQINLAIHRGGEGLSAITYQVEGHEVQTLLREPEVVHLVDVAYLVSIGKVVTGITFIAWLVWLIVISKQGYTPPSAKRQVYILGCLFLALFVVVIAVGPTHVFYWMHEWAFPDGHQWFFYYQESLMSTMMYAPFLFGYIAVQWFLLSLGILVLMHWVTMTYVYKK